jgi:hypothetical protein
LNAAEQATAEGDKVAVRWRWQDASDARQANHILTDTPARRRRVSGTFMTAVIPSRPRKRQCIRARRKPELPGAIGRCAWPDAIRPRLSFDACASTTGIA